MIGILIVLMTAFSVFAGVHISKALSTDNKRKAGLLLVMWAVIYAVYLIYILNNSA